MPDLPQPLPPLFYPYTMPPDVAVFWGPPGEKRYRCLLCYQKGIPQILASTSKSLNAHVENHHPGMEAMVTKGSLPTVEEKFKERKVIRHHAVNQWWYQHSKDQATNSIKRRSHWLAKQWRTDDAGVRGSQGAKDHGKGESSWWIQYEMMMTMMIGRWS